MTRLMGCLVALALLGTGCSPSLHDVIGRGDMALAAALLEANPELAHSENELGKQPLHYAVYYNQSDALDLLLNAGADVNAADNTGMTALHVAALMGKSSTIWLLEHGADRNQRDVFGDLPSHTAALGGRNRVLTALSKAGDPLTERNTAGLTPLELARKYRQDDTVAHIEGLLASPGSP